jgi:hypothetical protein
MRKIAVGILGASLLAGCSDGFDMAQLEYANIDRAVSRQFSSTHDMQPFAEGAVSIVVTEHGALETYTLDPCRNGTHICAGSPSGRAGHLHDGALWDVVSDAYRNRIFYLSPGGSGYMKRGNDYLPLAWD